MCAPSSRLSATRMPAMRYRFALDTWEIRQARTVCLTNCRSNSEYSSPLLLRMSITLGNARPTASSTVSPLMPRLYTCGSRRSSSRRRGTLSQSCLMLFFVSVMVLLYLTETNEATTDYLENEGFRHQELVSSWDLKSSRSGIVVLDRSGLPAECDPSGLFLKPET